MQREASINVLFLPDYSQNNPYQRELAQALAKLGSNVSLSNGLGPFPVLGAIRTGERPHIVHVHWTDHFMISRSGSRWKSMLKSIRFLSELLQVKARGTRIVWTVHNLTSHERRNWRIETVFNRICARLYDQIIVHCWHAQEAVLQTCSLPPTCKDKISVIPHGSYTSVYDNSVTRHRARQCFGFEEQDTVFLYLGQIRRYKGIPHLVSAFQELNHPRARLLIAGKPVDEAIVTELEGYISRDPRMWARLAFIPEGEIQVYMNAADAVALPYLDVLTSGGVLLAMSFGKAVIAPRLGCIPETLNDEDGLLYDSNREEGLLHALLHAMDADLAAMGRRNLERARKFDWDEIAQETYEVYRRCRA